MTEQCSINLGMNCR